MIGALMHDNVSAGVWLRAELWAMYGRCAWL